MLKVLLPSIATFLAVGSNAFASGAYVDENSIEFFGDGCPEGSVDVEVTDGDKLDVLFLENRATTDFDREFDATACSMKFDVYAPPGYRIAPSYVTMTGEHTVSPEGHATASAKLSVVGLPTLAAVEEYFGGPTDVFDVTSNPLVSPPLSSCGGMLRMRVVTRLTARRAGFEVSGTEQTQIEFGDGAVGHPYSIRCPIYFEPCD